MASARYNGIRLPVLPAEAANFPSRFIGYWTAEDVGGIAEGQAVLYCWDSLPTKVDDYNDNGLDYAYFAEGSMRRTYTTPYPYNNGDEWEFSQDDTPFVPCEQIYSGKTISNLTLARADGTILTTACEPIINADESFLLGVAVGMGLEGW